MNRGQVTQKSRAYYYLCALFLSTRNNLAGNSWQQTVRPVQLWTNLDPVWQFLQAGGGGGSGLNRFLINFQFDISHEILDLIWQPLKDGSRNTVFWKYNMHLCNTIEIHLYSAHLCRRHIRKKTILQQKAAATLETFTGKMTAIKTLDNS